MQDEEIASNTEKKGCIDHRTSTLWAIIITILFGIVSIISATRSSIHTVERRLRYKHYRKDPDEVDDIIKIFFTVSKIDYIFIALTIITSLLLFGVTSRDFETRKQRRCLLLPFILANSINGLLGIVGIIMLVLSFSNAFMVILINAIVLIIGVTLRLIFAVLMSLHYYSLTKKFEPITENEQAPATA